MRRFVLITLVAAGLLAGALPAQAGQLEWSDKADDATSFYVLASTPLPSDPALDVTKVKMVSDAKDLTWTASMKKMNEAGAANGAGYFFRFNFAVNEVGFTIRAKHDQFDKNVLYFRVASDLIGFDLPCKDCTAKFDFKASTVTVKTPIASLTEGMKAADSMTACPLCRAGEDPLPTLKKGDTFSALSVTAQRMYIRGTMTADDSLAPEGATFTL